MNDKKKEKPKEITLPADFVDGRKALQNLAEWGSDYLNVMSYMGEEVQMDRD